MLQIWQVDEALRDWFEVHVHVVDLVDVNQLIG